MREVKPYTVILQDAGDDTRVYFLTATSPGGAAAFCKRVMKAHGGCDPQVLFILAGEVSFVGDFVGVGVTPIHLYEMDTDS